MRQSSNVSQDPDPAGTLTIQLGKVLVTANSPVLGDMLVRILARRAETVMITWGVREGLTRIAENADLDLVLSDLEFTDGDGFLLLECVRALEEPRPKVILVSGRREESDASRAAELGAIGLLVKPIRFRDVARLLRYASGAVKQRRQRRRWGGPVFLVDAGGGGARSGAAPQLLWYVRDLSSSGAFLETETPLPLRSRLELTLPVGSSDVRVTAEVVRVQQPSWEHAGGVGVRFVDSPRAVEDLLEQHVAEAGSEAY